MTTSNHKNNRSLPAGSTAGFTIIESLIAITILVLAVIGTTSAIQTGISSYIFSKDQIVAFYLAQEGFEQIRNIRDENRLEDESWLTGLAGDPSEPCNFGKACTVDPVQSNTAIECDGGVCPVLQQDSNTGFFGYNSDPDWNDTIFTRKIMLTEVSPTEISVEVTVDWSKGLVDRQFKARENLLNWQNSGPYVPPPPPSPPPTFVRSVGDGDTSFGFNIGSPSTNRLVVIIADDESTGNNLNNITVDGKGCTLITRADNSSGLGNHSEMWYCDEDNLGSSSGEVNISASGGDSGWAVHAILYVNVSQSGPTDFGLDNTSVDPTDTVTVTGIDVPARGLVVAGWANGYGGLTINSQTSPLVTRQNGPDPGSADLFSSSGVEATSQTNKTYSVTWSLIPNRSTGIVASWAPL